MIVNIGEYEARFTEMFDQGDLEGLLTGIRDLVCKFVLHPHISSHFTGNALFLPVMDRLLQRSSVALGKPPRHAPDGNLILHIATEVEEVGGHTRVVEDVIRSLPDRRHLLILTDAFGHYRMGIRPMEVLGRRLRNLGAEWILMKYEEPVAGMVSKLAEMVADASPQSIFLHTHPYDVIANAAMNNASAPRVMYFHYNDYKPSLGATRNDFIHVDVTPVCYQVCRAHGFTRPIFLGLSVKDHGTVPPLRMVPLTAVTCGYYNKYVGKKTFSYGEIVAALFAAGLEKLFHIGEMPQAEQDTIRETLRLAGQDEERIVFLPNTPSLADSLVRIAPSFYLCSHPIGSGKAAIEAMSVGLPMVIPHGAEVSPLLCHDMSLGAGLMLRRLEDAPAVLAKIRSEGAALGHRVRRIYEDNHSIAVFRRNLLLMSGHSSTAARVS